jgi:hypothetical protein
MGRGRHRSRGKQRHGGGAMSSLRGGFRNVVKGGGQTKAVSPTKKFVWNLITIALVVAALVMLARRFGVIH